jgi:putative zinc finger/helix-turn-helix YgiT family protein
LSGEIRKYPYTVKMEGLLCPNCGYSTVDSKSMVELGRLVADEYRRAHGLLTSSEIVALRHRFNESQDAFAKRVGVGVASIKRWELGKIQDPQSNDLLIEKTKPQIENLQQYNNFAASGATLSFVEIDDASYSTQGVTEIRITRSDTSLIAAFTWDQIAATVPPYIANWGIRGNDDRDTAVKVRACR